MSHKATTSEVFEDIHQVFLGVIGDNMASLVRYVKYGDSNTTDTSTMGYYVIKFVSEAYTLQEDTICDRQIISSGELVFKAQYLICMQENPLVLGEEKSATINYCSNTNHFESMS